ncbi:MAG: sigma 54-interacting transcriptional regulator, partial [Ignavibacteriales bacterium]
MVNKSGSKAEVSIEKRIEARYMAVMEDQTSLVVGFAADGSISCVSRGFTLFLNASEESLLNAKLYSLIYEQDLSSLSEAMAQVEPGRAIRCDLRLNVAGRMAGMRWDIRGIYYKGEVIEYQASGRITAGDFMTRAQLVDGAIFRRLTEKIPVMLYLFGSRKFVFVNRTFEENFGYKHMELLNMDFWELIHPDFREIGKQRGLAILAGKESVPANTEVKGIKKNGEIIWADTFVNIVDLNGEAVGLVAAYDITERKRLEKAVEQANRDLENRVQERTAELRRANQELTTLNNNLNNIMQNMSDGVLLFSRDGQVKIMNPGFEKAWGHLVRSWRSFVDTDYFRRRVFEEGAFLQDEEFIVPTSKGQAHFVASAAPLRDDEGNVSASLVLVRPIEKVHRLVQRFTGAIARFRFEDIVTRSPKMFGVIETAKKAANSRSAVLIEGESGTGKEMFAHAIHNTSSRAKGPFVALNCAAIPRELVGSEMFGYVEGAFTGAKRGGNP